jgi:hypothetical protein
MKVLALIYADEGDWESLPEAEREARYAEYRAFGERAGTKIADGAELAPTRTATTVRVRDGELLVSDGPFAETKEQLGGFYLFEVESLDEAAEVATGIPAAAGGAIELRAESLEEAP